MAQPSFKPGATVFIVGPEFDIERFKLTKIELRNLSGTIWTGYSLDRPRAERTVVQRDEKRLHLTRGEALSEAREKCVARINEYVQLLANMR